MCIFINNKCVCIYYSNVCISIDILASPSLWGKKTQQDLWTVTNWVSTARGHALTCCPPILPCPNLDYSCLVHDQPDVIFWVSLNPSPWAGFGVWRWPFSTVWPRSILTNVQWSPFCDTQIYFLPSPLSALLHPNIAACVRLFFNKKNPCHKSFLCCVPVEGVHFVTESLEYIFYF